MFLYNAPWLCTIFILGEDTGKAGQTSVEMLIKLQTRAIRIIKKAGY